MRDEALRTSCFSQLAILCAEFGDDVPYQGGLDRGFTFAGTRVPFLNRQQGIFRAAAPPAAWATPGWPGAALRRPQARATRARDCGTSSS